MEKVIKKEAASADLILRGPSPIYEPAQGGLGYEIFRCLNLNKGKTAQVVDIDTEKILAKGKQGELRVKDKYMMNGYYKMDSASAFDSDGWFKTGDVVYFDEDYCLHIVDRVKDIIDYALHWINPSTIENILSQHPAVLENFVFGYPHPKDTEHTMAVVVLKDEYKNKVSEDEIIAFVNERVPNDWYKIRAGITFIDQMLKTPTGKLKRLVMKRAIIEKKCYIRPYSVLMSE